MVLVFDVAADMAMFRKPYTTTSAVSFPFPPPTAIAGLISAIVGKNHGSAVASNSAAFWDTMGGTRVSVGIRKRIAWATTGINLLKFKSANGSLGEHIQVKHQFVRKPRYRIYVEGGQLYADLRTRLMRNEFIYTPYLGLAYCIAEISFVGEFDSVPWSSHRVAVDTVVPIYGELEPDVLASGDVHKEIVPFRMNRDRRLMDTVPVLYPEIRKDGESKLVISKPGDVQVTEVGDDRVAWFKPW